MENKKKINREDVFLKYDFLLEEKKTAFASVKAKNEKEAKRLIKERLDDPEFEKTLDVKSELFVSSIDEEVVIEETCETCGAVLMGRVSRQKFTITKEAGKMICPYCHNEVMPCDDCGDHNLCDNCPYKKGQFADLVAVNGEDFVSEEKELEVYKKFSSCFDVLKDGLELAIPSRFLTDIKDNVYKKAYDLICRKGIMPSYCNDCENDKYRYASYVTLENKIRIYCEWLIPADFVDKEDPQEEMKYNPMIFTPDRVDYFTVDLEQENE